MNIKSFSLSLLVKDNASVIKDFARYTKPIEDMMRDEGYVPLIDLDPQFEWTYNDDETFTVKIDIYGGYIGEKAWEVKATSINTKIQKYLHDSKPKVYSKA